MRLLITGAAGFVGANVMRALIARDHEVFALTKPTTDTWRLQPGDVEPARIFSGDLAQTEHVRTAVRAARPECIVHCAARGAYPGQRDAVEMAQANVVGWANILAAAAEYGCGHVVNTGSSSEYGNRSAGPAESSPLEPNSIYAATKACASWMAQGAMDLYGIAVTTLRLYSVYGYWEEPARLMPRICAFGLMGRFPPLAEPSLVRDYVWIDDVAQAYVTVVESGRPAGCRIMNVGSGVETRLDDVVAAAARVFEISGRPAWGGYERRSWETTRWYADPSMIRRECGWAATTGLDEGLGLMRRWLEADGRVCGRYLAAAGLAQSGRTEVLASRV